MALVVYDMTIGQWAGIPITTTGKTRPPNDGTEGYAMLVSPVDAAGDPIAVGLLDDAGVRINPATEDTLEAVRVILDTPVAYLPLPGAAESSDTTLTRVLKNISSGTTTEIVAATASQTTRVYRMLLTCDAANVVTFKSASTAIMPVITFGSSGGSVTLDFSGYWWMTTATNEALNVTTTTTAAVGIATDYIKSA